MGCIGMAEWCVPTSRDNKHVLQILGVSTYFKYVLPVKSPGAKPTIKATTHAAGGCTATSVYYDSGAGIVGARDGV